MKKVSTYLYFNLIFLYWCPFFNSLLGLFLFICEYFILVFNPIQGLRKSIHIIGLEEKNCVILGGFIFINYETI
jgi:hypothetical protein